VFGLDPRLTTAAGSTAEAFASADMRVPDPAAFSLLSHAARQLVNRQKFASSSICVQDGLGFPAYNASEEGKRLADVSIFDRGLAREVVKLTVEQPTAK